MFQFFKRIPHVSDWFLNSPFLTATTFLIFIDLLLAMATACSQQGVIPISWLGLTPFQTTLSLYGMILILLATSMVIWAIHSRYVHNKSPSNENDPQMVIVDYESEPDTPTLV